MSRGDGDVDFNDLHVSRGLDVVRGQLEQALNDAPFDGTATDPRAPAAPAEKNLAYYLSRYFITLPDGKIWDNHANKYIKPVQFRRIAGPKLFGQWQESLERQERDQADLDSIAFAAQRQGDGGLADALDRYVYLYPVSEAWDLHNKVTIPLKDLRNAIADVYQDWLEHPERKQIDKDQLVFDPTLSLTEESGYINRFKGLPLSVSDVYESNAKCLNIINLFLHLCNSDVKTWNWLLDWMAYPLQFPGKKMATSVLVHSPRQGAGKSLAFDKIYGRIFGDYAQVFTQNTLEQNYNDYISGCLFGVFEEVFSRSHKYQISGFLKQLISGETFWVEKKFVSGWKEGNFMNCVFLSNEIQPFPVEVYDRRFLVIWPENKLSPEFADEIGKEMDGDGIQNFYDYLMRRDLDHFSAHSKPPMNEAKRRIISVGLQSWEVFAGEWLDGELDLPPFPLLVGQLFKCYKNWAKERKENTIGQHRFTAFVRSLERCQLRADIHYHGSKKTGRFIVPDGMQPPEGKTQGEFYGECVKAASDVLSAYDGIDV